MSSLTGMSARQLESHCLHSRVRARTTRGIERRPVGCQLAVPAECVDSLCERNDCGAAGSIYDSHGCYRTSCTDDDDCATGGALPRGRVRTTLLQRRHARHADLPVRAVAGD